MKRIFLLTLTLIFVNFVWAQEEKKQTIDQQIDTAFGDATGWFVKFVFYQIPFGSLDENVSVKVDIAKDKFKDDGSGNLIYKETTTTYQLKNDSIYVSNIVLSGGQVATNLKVLNNQELVTVKGNSFALKQSESQKISSAQLKASAPFTKIFWVLFPLILGALFFTAYFKLINFKGFFTAINVVRGKYDDLEDEVPVQVSPSEFTDAEDNPDTIRVEGGDGEVSHFQALTAALSATVGLGNIAGVAIAVSIGGAGATFWMIIAGFLGMASKFVECTLGVKYRDVAADGTVYGGPMYYLTKGLKSKGMGMLGKVLAVLFAIFVIGGSFGGGNMFQVNQAFQLVQEITGGSESFLQGYGWAFGFVMSILVGIVIIGGIKSIAKVTDKIVPFMVAIYVMASLFVIISNYELIGYAFKQIFDGAFQPLGIAGGVVGVLVQGFRRAAFSNEAGIGSASIAHSAVKTKYAASEGLVALLEPFIDTVIVCTMTALVLIITGFVDPLNPPSGNAQAILLTSSAFESSISWFPYVLTVAVVLFAFSSMISWSYYGFQGWTYLFGRSKKMEYIYKFLFCVFVIVGAAASLNAVIDFSDAMVFAMMIPNMIGLVLLAPKVKEELRKYMNAIKEKK